jgi:hypothetical protein
VSVVFAGCGVAAVGCRDSYAPPMAAAAGMGGSALAGHGEGGGGSGADDAPPVIAARRSPLTVGSDEFERLDPRVVAPSSEGGASGGASPVPAAPYISREPADRDASFARGNAVYGLPDQRVLRLTHDLTIVDLRDPNNPLIEGRLALDDFPVELLVEGDRVFVLSNAKQYWGSRVDIDYEWGGRITSIDISDRAHPKRLASATAPGWLLSGMLKSRDETRASLYVATAAQAAHGGAGASGHGNGKNAVASYDIALESGVITPRSEQSVPDVYSLELQAGGTTLLAFGEVDDPSLTDGTSQSQLEAAAFDVSSPDANLSALGTLRLEGAQVADRRALDVRGSVLRTVSYGRSGYPESLDSTGQRALHHIETFDLSAGNALARIDHCSFDAGQYTQTSLFSEAGVLVVGTTAHAYAIDAQGHCRDVGSPPLQAGSPSTLRAFAGGSRVLEVVENTESAPAGANRPTQAQLTIYDATDFARLSPISRVNFAVQLDAGYRSPDSVEVVEGGSAAHAADGTTESGMILLAGWEAWNVLPGAMLSRAVRDASGHLVIVTDPSQTRDRARDTSAGVVLQVLDPQDLHVLGATPVDSAASWIGSARDRAAFAVPGGTSIIDYIEATQPKLHAYLPGGVGTALFDGEYLYTPERRIDVRASQHVTSP